MRAPSEPPLDDQVAANPTEALLAGASGSGFEMELGQVTMAAGSNALIRAVVGRD